MRQHKARLIFYHEIFLVFYDFANRNTTTTYTVFSISKTYSAEPYFYDHHANAADNLTTIEKKKRWDYNEYNKKGCG